MSRLTFLLVASLLAACDVLKADETPGPALHSLHVAQANDDFGLQLLHRLELAEKTERGQKHSLQTPRNLLISPLSLSSVLTMLMAGGRNVTGEEIKNTLGFEKMTEQDVFTGFSHLLQGVKSTSGENNKHITLQMANSIALQNTFRLLPEYERVIRESFGATPFPVDFSRHAHEATASINAWVAQQTHNKVEKLFKEDLDAESVLVLLNALYFKGAWQYRFNASQTVDAPFRYELPNVQALVPTMTLRGTLRYAHFDDGDLVELPYADSSLSMLIYLPDIRWVKDYQTIAGQFERYGGRASVKIAERLSALRNTTVRLHLPRFSITGDYSSLNEPLQNLGIRTAFSSARADLSRINGHPNLFLSKVAHKAVIEVNEEGSEAAAATGADLHLKSLPIVQEFNANRPFLFLIRDNLQQVTLFAGVVNKP